MARSFEAINYMLRPNKNVERKLIAETLLHLKASFPIKDYRYVGFGSMWFSDFVLMHRSVGLSDLVSIERERPKRVEFNKPFGCIDVQFGDASDRLGEVLSSKKPAIVWLDYDGGLEAAMGGDIELAVSSLQSGSMVLVTVNAMVGQLDGRRRDGEAISPIEYLTEIVGSPTIKTKADQLTRANFPQLVADILHERLKSAVLSYVPGSHYHPIWTFQYKDDAIMITVGGMIADDADQEKIEAPGALKLPFVSPSQCYQIELPVLTEKEKRALDRLLPTDAAIAPEGLPFELRLREIEAYRRFYLQYPVFNEMAA